MFKVGFVDDIDDGLLKFAIIVSKSEGKWVFCKHKERDTYEVPGGKREPDEDIFKTAKRELYEETGAVKYDISPVCAYLVESEIGDRNYGMLYFADIKAFEAELHSEIEKIIITDTLVEKWTYPSIQPKLIEELARRGIIDKIEIINSWFTIRFFYNLAF